MRGIINIIIGVIFVIGGLSGTMVVRGTSSRGGIIAVGAVLIGIGVFRLMRANA
jgi:hypothetical protein